MENPNTLFDTWMDVQNKMTKNMVEMNEKLQKTMSGGEMLEKGSDLYKEWLEKQKSLLTNLVNQTSNGSSNGKNNATETNNNPADFFQNWMNMQNEGMQKWMETSRSFTENMMKG